jgi:hypothetical protein
VPVASYLPWITGGGGGLVVMAIGLWLFATGKLHSDAEYSKLEAERDYWRDASGKLGEALDIERRAVNETAQAGRVTNQLITALTTIATGRRAVPPRPDLTPEDLGL